MLQVAKRNAAEALLNELGYSNTASPNKPNNQIRLSKEPETVPHNNGDKGRKVTFMEESQESQPSQSIGGSGGRQLVPGVLLVTEQTAGM